jgi:hypothetical protein
MQRVTSPIMAAILIIGLLALAAGGAYVATHPTVDDVHQSLHTPTISSPLRPIVTIRNIRIPSADPYRMDPAELLVRGQPMRWNQAEARAVQQKAAGQQYDPDEYRAAMKAAQYNQKNGWTDDGTERTGQGTPLRNNQKRVGNSNKSQSGSDSCLQSFALTASVCGDGGEDITGGDGEGGPELGGIDLEEL